MFGLFVNTYDYHEWNDLVAVSEYEDMLEMYDRGEPYPLIDAGDYEAYQNEEMPHYLIKEIECLT